MSRSRVIAVINQKGGVGKATSTTSLVYGLANETEQKNTLFPANEGIVMLELPIYFGIAQVSEIKLEMDRILSQPETTIQINAADVESIDTAATQLILAFIRQAESSGKQVSFSAYSAKISSVAALLNIKQDLGIG